MTRHRHKRAGHVDPMDLMPALDRVIDGMLFAQCGVGAGMKAILTAGHAMLESPAWARLERVRWTAQDATLTRWFRDWLCKNPPPARVKGYWFGAPEILLNPPWLDWSGTRAFTLDDVDCGWAKGIYPQANGGSDGPPPSVRPLECLFNAAKVLGVDTRYKSEDAVQRYEEQSLFLPAFAASLGYTCLLVSHLLTHIDPKLWLGRSRQRGFAVGFSAGGHHQLGVLTSDGWTPRPLSWNGFLDDERI